MKTNAFPPLHLLQRWLLILAVWSGWAVLQAAAPVPPPAPGPITSDQEVETHLDSVIAWYRQSQLADGWAVQPGDIYYRDILRDLSRKIVTDSFDYARAMVPLVGDGAKAAVQNGPGNERETRLNARLAANRDQLAQLHDQQAVLTDRIAAAGSAQDLNLLQAQAAVLQARIDLAEALDDTLHKAFAMLTSGSDATDAAGLESRLDLLQGAVPEVFAAHDAAPTQPKLASGPVAGGLISRVGALFTLISNQRAMDGLSASTTALQAAASRRAEPIVAELKGAMQVGTDQSGGNLTDPAGLEELRRSLAQATTRFRGLSSALLPLREEAKLLEQSHANLAEWQHSLAGQRDGIIRYLLVHAVALALGFAGLLALSEVSRRATVRYVVEPRRRRQFLVLRRVLAGLLMVVVILTVFVGDFGSIATYAGFLTAGIAVALQTVILSVAAYFFLIGRYGVKVGDRVTVSGVTGDVIDLGLVRIFLLELAGTGADMHPTGRIVVLANSLLFSAGPVFKQLPGTNYAWHELHVPIVEGADPAPAEKLLLQAVLTVYSGYREAIERQHGALGRLIDFPTELPAPAGQVRVTEAGLEVVVRYPADLAHLAEIDGKVTREVLAALQGAAEIKKSLGALPRIRALVKN